MTALQLPGTAILEDAFPSMRYEDRQQEWYTLGVRSPGHRDLFVLRKANYVTSPPGGNCSRSPLCAAVYLRLYFCGPFLFALFVH